MAVSTTRRDDTRVLDRLSTYDLLLAVMPAPLVAGLTAGVTLSVPVTVGMAVGGVLAATLLAYALFVAAPVDDEGEAASIGGDGDRRTAA